MVDQRRTTDYTGRKGSVEKRSSEGQFVVSWSKGEEKMTQGGPRPHKNEVKQEANTLSKGVLVLCCAMRTGEQQGRRGVCGEGEAGGLRQAQGSGERPKMALVSRTPPVREKATRRRSYNNTQGGKCPG